MPDQPQYGILQQQPQNKNFILSTHHQFQCRKIPTVTYFCQSANLSGLNLESIPQPTIFNNIPRPATKLKPENLTLSFVVDEELKNWLEIYNWMQSATNQTDFDKYEDPSKHLNSESLLFILDSNNIARFKVNFYNIFPISLGGLNFDTQNTDSTPMYSEVTFDYTHHKITKI